MVRNLACGFIGLAVGVEGGTGGYLTDVADIATASASSRGNTGWGLRMGWWFSFGDDGTPVLEGR